uniref:Uncharacterized protein n=1 Tax=Arundo donax TaxID=35708 RepID=A0A0A9BMH1_ARUDO
MGMLFLLVLSVIDIESAD